MTPETLLSGDFSPREDKWECSNGHECPGWQVGSLSLGGESWCSACLGEKVTPILAALGVGKVSRKEAAKT